MRKNIIILIFISLCISPFLSKYAFSKGKKESDWKTLIASDIEKERYSSKQIVLDTRMGTIDFLISVVNRPVQIGEEFYSSSTSRNIAIILLGNYRAKEAVLVLSQWLLPKPGQGLNGSELLMFSQAGYALVEIGLPSLPHLVELLKNGDPELLEQCVKIIVSIKGLPETELLFETLISKEKDETKSKNLRKAIDFLKEPKIHKILERIDERRPNKVE